MKSNNLFITALLLSLSIVLSLLMIFSLMDTLFYKEYTMLSISVMFSLVTILVSLSIILDIHLISKIIRIMFNINIEDIVYDKDIILQIQETNECWKEANNLNTRLIKNSSDIIINNKDLINNISDVIKSNHELARILLNNESTKESTKE